MVDRQRQVEALLHADRAVGCHDRTRGDCANAKDGCLGQVNDGGEGLDTEGADVGDREGAAAQEVGGDGAVDGTAGQALGLVGERLEAQGLRGADDGDEEAARGVACKAEVDLLELGEYAVLEVGVEHGVLGQGARHGEADQVVERDLTQAQSRVGILDLLAHGEDAGGVRGGVEGQLRGGRQGLHHALGDDLAHALERGGGRDTGVIGTRRGGGNGARGRGGLGRSAGVGDAHAATNAGAFGGLDTGGARGGGQDGTRSDRGGDVALDDATVGAGTLGNGRGIQARRGGQGAGTWGDRAVGSLGGKGGGSLLGCGGCLFGCILDGCGVVTGHEAGDVFSGFTDDDERILDGDLVAFLPQELQDGALGGGRDLHRRLVRLDGCEGLVDGDAVAFSDHPLDDDA